VKLKLDANLGTRGRRLLTDAGHDVSTAEVQGLARAPDDLVLATCTTEGRALVTLDTDFADAMRYPPLLRRRTFGSFRGAIAFTVDPARIRRIVQAARCSRGAGAARGQAAHATAPFSSTRRFRASWRSTASSSGT
jgi:hypothetical protein